MKTKILCILGLFLLISPLFSQPEKQWLIWNGYGKNGVGTNGINIYSNPITADFTLRGIISPDLSGDINAGNDIFIIYKGGYHFNPRTHTGQGFFYNQGDFTNGIKDHYFVNNSKNTMYLYLTNRYEGDDLPGTVRAQSGQLSTAQHTYTLDVTNAALLSANHNVVYNRDITVIINYDSLRILDTIKEGKHAQFILKFDGIQTIGSPDVNYNIDFLDLQPVFGTNITGPLSPVYPIPTPPYPVGTEVKLTPSPGSTPYGYINFRKTSTLFPPFTNGKPQYNAIFTIKRDGQFVRQLAEPIRSSFDPNFLKVVSICQSTDKSYIVTYHLQFENISSDPADLLWVVIDFPSQFDLSCLRAFNWNAAGTGCGGNTNVVGNTSTFKFNGNLGIFHNHADRLKGIGYFDFKVKVKSGVMLNDPNISSLKLDSVVVYFDKQPFPIEDFRDLVECSQDGSKNPDKHPDSSEVDNSKDPKESDKDKKSNDATKSASSSKADDFGHMNMKAPPEGGAYHCYRPITTKNCNCRPPFKWIYILGGVAAVALVTSFFMWKRRRQKRKNL